MKYLIGFIIGIMFLGLLFSYPILLWISSETVSDCIIKTERTGGDDGKYLVFGKNEVYENTDSLIRFKFNSSDFYRDIQNGKCYTFKVQGWRVPFLSWYRNIYKLDK